MSRHINIVDRDDLICLDNDLNLQISAKIGSDFVENKFNEVNDKFLNLGVCSEFYDYLLQLSKDDWLDFITIIKHMPNVLMITFEVFGIGLPKYNDIAYFSEPVAFEDLLNVYNSNYKDCVRGSYLFSSTYNPTDHRVITGINVAGLILEVEDVKYRQLVDLYKSKPHGEPLLTISDDMYKKLTKANLLGKRAVVERLDGDIPIIKYE